MSSLSLSHIPRRLQVALVLVLGLVVLWVAVLQKMVSSSSESSSPAPPASSATSTHPHALAAAAGAAGTAATHAAHHATAATSSQHAAAASAHRGTAASSQGKPAHASAHAAGAAAATTHAASTHAAATSRATAPAHAAAPNASPAATLTPLQSIESALGQQRTVLLLFWDPKAVTDQFVRGQLQSVARSLHGAVAAQYALSSQVGEFGQFTQKLLVTETPTILLITPSKKVTALVGYNEASSIIQAVAEARAAEKPGSSATTTAAG